MLGGEKDIFAEIDPFIPWSTAKALTKLVDGVVTFQLIASGYDEVEGYGRCLGCNKFVDEPEADGEAESAARHGVSSAPRSPSCDTYLFAPVSRT